MTTKEENTIEAHMLLRRERPVLCLRRTVGQGVLRYAVGVSDSTPPLYSIYAECALSEEHTVGEIPHFSDDRDKAERFCCLLEHCLATPLSLEALYEDSLTP